ncbi:MAG: hypothetical protein AAFY88_01715, partial [Acidobacteriota bacterium]
MDAKPSLLPLPSVSPHQERLDDEQRVKSGGVPHFAAVLEVEADPWRFGDCAEQGASRRIATGRLRPRAPPRSEA